MTVRSLSRHLAISLLLLVLFNDLLDKLLLHGNRIICYSTHRISSAASTLYLSWRWPYAIEPSSPATTSASWIWWYICALCRVILVVRLILHLLSWNVEVYVLISSSVADQIVLYGHVTIPQFFLVVGEMAVVTSWALLLILVLVAWHSLEFRRVINADSLFNSFEVILVERIRFSLVFLFFMHFGRCSSSLCLALLFICSMSAHSI